MLPARKTKAAKRSTRWKSQAHCTWLRGFACAVCGSVTNTVVAHVRLGSHAGMGQKPDDWRAVPLCDGPRSNNLGQLGCHDRQHIVGEATFWAKVGKESGQSVEALIDALCKASPKRGEIAARRAEANG